MAAADLTKRQPQIGLLRATHLQLCERHRRARKDADDEHDHEYFDQREAGARWAARDHGRHCGRPRTT